MAEVIASDLAAGLIRKLVSLATDEVIQVWKLDEDLETLRERFELTGALLNDAHSQNLIMSTAKMWFNKLEHVARVAEAFMDELEYEVTRRKVENHSKVSDFFIPSKNTILYRFKVARKIKSINTSFDKICKRASDLGLKPVEHLRSIMPHKQISNTPPFEDESLIVGRDDDLSFLVNMLCNKNDEGLPVHAILGMGGQGKTTLACMVYNKDTVIKMFSKRMWVTVSDDFDFMKILNQMVVSLTSKPSVLDNTEGLIKDLREKLKGEKFLLVLDDVWNEKPAEWEKLRNSLLAVGGATGSSILVTTRKQEVIDAMRCSDPYRVQKLSEADSWELFKHRAFTDGGVSETETFVALGKRMVERCVGMPLAIKTLGGLLYSKKTEEQWLHIQNSEVWTLKGVLPSLRLSYDNLPYSSLKRCFAYCSVIPKDSYINKDELIQIWMALGFLLQDGGVLMEDIGNEYFDILLRNCLLQDVERDEYGNIYKCKMHDLVHDLAFDVSSDYSATVMTSRDINKVSKALYVRLEGSGNLKPNILKVRFDSVQALYAEANVFNVVLRNLEHLRVLVLNSFGYKLLPSSIENLKYLKHLDISSFDTRYKLPIYITRLYNLQTLRISYNHELPEKVCNLINLRHLVSERRYMFIGIERLTCLQTMPPFVVSRDENCLVGQLGGLKNLRGRVSLYDLNEVTNFEEASKAKLCEKSNILHLELKWNERIDGEYNDEDVMEGLEAHPNLKGLSIDGFMGKKFASWITMMTNLVEITFSNCNRCEVLPPLGHLPKLRKMRIEGMENVKVMGSDLSGGVDSGVPKAVTTTLYPSLTQLYLWGLPKLEEWVETVISAFPKLESLKIRGCPRLRKIPNNCFPSLKKLKIKDLESSMILESLSTNVSSLTSLELKNISDGGGGGDSSTSSCWCSNLEFRINVLLKTNSLSLTELRLHDCKELKRLTLGVSLDMLDVNGCPHLISINSVEGLAICLKSIWIRGVPSSHLDGVFAHILNSSTLETLGLGEFWDELDEFTWPFSWPFSSVISFPNLTHLRLRGWEKARSITLFDQLELSTFPALTELSIWDFKGVKALPDSIAKLPSLKILYIFDCEILESLPTFEESHGLESLYTVEGVAICLKSIRIGGVHSSHLDGVFAHILNSSTLEYLELGRFWDELDEFTRPFSSVIYFPNLIQLSLVGWEKARSIALFDQLEFSTFPALTQLSIQDFKGVKALPDLIAKLPSLKILFILEFEGVAICLKSIRIGGVHSSHLDGVFAHILNSSTLEYLELGRFWDELDEFTRPFSSVIYFPNLIQLSLVGWEKARSIALFDQLEFSTFPALTQLSIQDFKGVKALPDLIAKLPSLKILFILECEILESLPTFEESHGIEHLAVTGVVDFGVGALRGKEVEC
ncbi:putative disease resistance protein RGA3 [Heracleum sosnowskyi]|uniref:Disease resistance protein RGA3 n=1 Tax=Heracleum sosnowskyi TaxID=360622 RepID=A0AAD8HDA0_9APIA|nr:putative disease resistance protein RGA3 [Heracleum sosnowskyi]